MTQYAITSHRHLPGVRLSKLGHWGNMPFPDDGAAEQAARDDAGSEAITISRRSYRGLPQFTGESGAAHDSPAKEF